MVMTHIVEIPEAEASGALTAAYRDIRAVTEVGMVNLIWRHMATIPNALDWAWGSVRPLFVSGRIAAESAALVDALDLPEAPAIAPEALAAAGVSEHSLDTIRVIIDDYNRGNAANLFAMPALGHFIAAGGAGRPPAEPEASQPALPRGLPPIVAMDEMDSATAALVREMSAPISPPEQAMIPSLYRHLAAWPGFLQLAAASVLSPANVQGVVSRAEAAHARADAVAAEMAPDMAPPAGCAPPDADALAHLQDIAPRYARGPIATMVVLGHLLRRALPQRA
jgi:hypothetical protein